MVILAVDYGDSRTGIAVCDAAELMAHPIGIIEQKAQKKILQGICDAVKKENAELVVVGLPLNMNGSAGQRAELCRAFASKLGKKIAPVKVCMYDERSTTVIAHGYLNDTDTRGKKRRQVVDAVAATVILEDFLKYRKNTGAS